MQDPTQYAADFRMTACQAALTSARAGGSGWRPRSARLALATAVAVFGGLSAIGFSGAVAHAACADPAAAEAVRAQIATECNCTDQGRNHGQYVSCVVQAINRAVANGLPVNCKGTIARCAARSSCGKGGFVTCCFAYPGRCRNGKCQDRVTPCTAPEQCPIINRCRVSATAPLCTAKGGSPGSGSCCDATCSLPPPLLGP